jgi:hypothetical protein
MTFSGSFTLSTFKDVTDWFSLFSRLALKFDCDLAVVNPIFEDDGLNRYFDSILDMLDAFELKPLNFVLLGVLSGRGFIGLNVYNSFSKSIFYVCSKLGSDSKMVSTPSRCFHKISSIGASSIGS